MKIYHLFICRWPFDRKSPLGYLMAWGAQTAGLTALAITAVAFYILIFGTCELFAFMAEDIAADLATFKIDLRMNAEADRAERMQHFRDIVQLYSEVKK